MKSDITSQLSSNLEMRPSEPSSPALAISRCPTKQPAEVFLAAVSGRNGSAYAYTVINDDCSFVSSYSFRRSKSVSLLLLAAAARAVSHIPENFSKIVHIPSPVVVSALLNPDGAEAKELCIAGSPYRVGVRFGGGLDDPVVKLPLNVPNVSWRVISLDLNSELKDPTTAYKHYEILLCMANRVVRFNKRIMQFHKSALKSRSHQV